MSGKAVATTCLEFCPSEISTSIPFHEAISANCIMSFTVSYELCHCCFRGIFTAGHESVGIDEAPYAAIRDRLLVGGGWLQRDFLRHSTRKAKRQITPYTYDCRLMMICVSVTER